MFAGLLSAALIMAAMIPLIFLFRLLPGWGRRGYCLAAGLVGLGAVGLLALAVQETFEPRTAAWFGILGGLLGWTLAELSHEMGQISLEDPKIALMLGLFLAGTIILWPFFPHGAQFWLAVFTLNWGGHVFIRVCQQTFPRETTARIFALTAAGFGLLMLALIALPFFRPLDALSQLWAGTGIWFSLAMIFFLTLYPDRLGPETA